MHEASLGADDLGEMRQEGDDVCLVSRSIASIRSTSNFASSPSPSRPCRFLRDDPKLGHRVGRMRLDLEPDAEARLGVQIAVISGRA